MPTLLILALFFLVFVLIKASDEVVKALRRLSRETHTKTFILSAILLAMALGDIPYLRLFQKRKFLFIMTRSNGE